MTQPQNSEDITPTAVITITSQCRNFFKVWVSLPSLSTRPQLLTLALCLTTAVSFPTTVGGYGGRSIQSSLSREYEGATQEFVKPCVSYLGNRHPVLSRSPWSPGAQAPAVEWKATRQRTQTRGSPALPPSPRPPVPATQSRRRMGEPHWPCLLLHAPAPPSTPARLCKPESQRSPMTPTVRSHQGQRTPTC